jgi:hypothetical protein
VESLVLSSNLKGLPVQVVEHRCYAVLVWIFSCYKACPFSLDFFKSLNVLFMVWVPYCWSVLEMW